MSAEIYAPDYLRSQDDKQLHLIADMIEKQVAKIQRLELEKQFIIQYLDPADTSFKTMINDFVSLPLDKKEKLVKLSESLAEVCKP